MDSATPTCTKSTSSTSAKGPLEAVVEGAAPPLEEEEAVRLADHAKMATSKTRLYNVSYLPIVMPRTYAN